MAPHGPRRIQHEQQTRPRTSRPMPSGKDTIRESTTNSQVLDVDDIRHTTPRSCPCLPWHLQAQCAPTSTGTWRERLGRCCTILVSLLLVTIAVTSLPPMPYAVPRVHWCWLWLALGECGPRYAFCSSSPSQTQISDSDALLLPHLEGRSYGCMAVYASTAMTAPMTVMIKLTSSLVSQGTLSWKTAPM
jgi:hypothetical protein